jgi:hypothetical protein
VAANAGSPRLIQGVPNSVVVLASGPSGDRFEIWAHDWLADAWTLASTLETGGTVTAFETYYFLDAVIAWRDETGAVRVRYRN